MYCVIVCSIMFWCFAINVKAEENDLIMYDYVHQTEHKYSIGLDRKLQKTKKKEGASCESHTTRRTEPMS